MPPALPKKKKKRKYEDDEDWAPPGAAKPGPKALIPRPPKPLPKPELCHLGEDPSEKYDLAAKHPEIVERLAKLGEKLQASVKPVPDQLVPRIGK